MILNGTATLTSTGSISYTPSTGFFGTDEFLYSATDPDGASANATVSITINSVNIAPIAVDDAIDTDEEVAVNISVTANDSDPDGLRADLVIASLGTPLNGTATRLSDSVVTYEPDTGFVGSDTFDYSIEDLDGATASAFITVNVEAVTGPPVNPGPGGIP